MAKIILRRPQMHIETKNYYRLKKGTFSSKQAQAILDVILDPENGLISKTYFELSLSKLKSEIVKYLLVQFIAIIGLVLTIMSIILDRVFV